MRVDGGVREGDTISPHYDPMIAKLIVHGQDREQARQRMLRALGAVRCTGVQTNIAFLGRLMDDPAGVDAALADGAARARDIAGAVMEEVRATVGFLQKP